MVPKLETTIILTHKLLCFRQLLIIVRSRVWTSVSSGGSMRANYTHKNQMIEDAVHWSTIITQRFTFPVPLPNYTIFEVDAHYSIRVTTSVSTPTLPIFPHHYCVHSPASCRTGGSGDLVRTGISGCRHNRFSFFLYELEAKSTLLQHSFCT